MTRHKSQTYKLAHLADLLHLFGERGLDHVPADLHFLVHTFLDGLYAAVVKSADAPHHPDGLESLYTAFEIAYLVDRAVVVVLRIRVLLQEVLSDHLGDL